MGVYIKKYRADTVYVVSTGMDDWFTMVSSGEFYY
jgi:hypothetical protein